MFPLTEATPLMDEKPPKLSFFLCLSGVLYHMLAEPRSPTHPPISEENPLIAKVKAGGEKNERKKIESEPLGNPWTSSSIRRNHLSEIAIKISLMGANNIP